MDGDRDAGPVSYGRWQEAHARLQDQVRDLRADFDAFVAETRTQVTRRRDRQWMVALAFLTALVLPLAVAAIISLVTLR